MATNFDICFEYLKKKLILNDQLDGYNTEQNELLLIVKKTVDFGESDSVIVFGPNGCGKSLVTCILFCILAYIMLLFSMNLLC